MKSKIQIFLSAFAILALVLGSLGMSPAQGSTPVENAPIHLKGGSFIPGQGEPALPPGLTIAAYKANERGYYIVQFRGPVEEAWKANVAAQGAELLDYIPDFAFKVRMNPGQAKKVADLAEVGYVGIFQPAYKLSPDLANDGQQIYRITTEQGANKGLTNAAIHATGAEILFEDGNTLEVLADIAQVQAIANISDVAWVDNYSINAATSAQNSPKPNDVGGGNLIGAAVANGRGYTGSTQIVAVADTGIGGGTATTAHRDIPSSRVAAIYNWVGLTDSCFKTIQDDGSIDVDSGHGTHTTGSVLSGGAPNGIGKGTAPQARLVFQSTENYVLLSNLCKTLYGYTDGYYLTGLPSDLKTLFQQAYNAGARVHSNSWGSAQAGKYTADSANADSFVWTNRDMVITFSAGNEGIDANSDGAIDFDSLGSPATAKNVITIGASENVRPDNYPCDINLTYLANNTSCALQNGYNSIFTWGGAWPADYPANPVKDDLSAGNANQVTAFSSRGPADDGRIKPDLVAPGSWILSTYSDMYQQGYDASANPKNGAWQYDGYGFPYDAYYKYLSGTSMSNPLAAGGAAVVRDYYQKAYGVNASAALVKATMINTAVDMLDENIDGVNDNDFPIPNNHEGWGLINLDAATDGQGVFVDEGSGLATNATQTFTVTSNGGPLKISVVWSDYPSTATASVNLVNDLDVTVSGPSSTYLGNVFSGGWSVTGGSADRRNNVENVYLQNASAGTYTVTVKGYNVPSGPQKFALVVRGGTFGSVTPTPTGTPTSTPTATPTATVTPPPSTSTGYLPASANVAVNSGDKNGYQTSPNNAYADDGLFASDIDSGSGTSTSCTNNKKDRHIFYNYNLNVPGGATVQGIQVRLDAKADSTASAPYICVELSWDGGTTWTAAKSTATLTTAEATYILGGAADTWGRAWTTANLGNSTLRVRVTDVSSSISRDFYLDYIAVNVNYQP